MVPSLQARRIVIVANPKAGARSGRPLVEQVAELLRQQDFLVEIVYDIGDLMSHVQTALENRDLHAVVAAGGDGTAAMVVNLLPPGAPLAMIPLGTENLFSKYLGVHANPRSICETIIHGEPVQLDAGRAGDRLFLIMLGCGFDAEVVRRVHRERTGHIHHLTYAKPILESIRSYEYPQLRVYFSFPSEDERPRAGGSSQPEMLAGRWAFVVNIPRYAGGLSIAPAADGADGLLDVCTFKHGSLWNGLMYLGGVWLQQHHSWTDFQSVRAGKIRIEADAPDVPYQLDGDPGGVLPVDVEVLPGRITVLAPQAWRQRHGLSVAQQRGA
ncbi:MAG: protein BmrU [Planctomycetes bacterium]|nr:protein BmrU [Planctomycetota bacterium]